MSNYKPLGMRIQIVETGDIFKTSRECAEYIGVSQSAISSCLAGKFNTCGGYHLRWLEVNYHDEVPYEIFEGNVVEIDYAPGYFVSDLGIVYGPGSLGRRGWHRVDTYSNDEDGHQVVDLYIDGKRRHRYLAVLVAEAFIPNPHNYPLVRHYDGNPYNNHVSNLRWGTYADNMRDAIRHETFHYFTEEEHEMALQELRTPVRAINIRTGVIQDFVSQAEAARILHVHQPNIRHVLSGWYKQTGGYKFEYLDREGYDE
jgi:predicted XRE-type DNA-binding protein